MPLMSSLQVAIRLLLCSKLACPASAEAPALENLHLDASPLFR